MTSSHQSAAKKARGCAFGTCLAWAFLALAVLLVLLLIIVFGSFRSAEQLVQAEIIRIREAGEPTDDKSMEEWFRAQTHSDGTDAWQQIISQTVNLIEGQPNLSQLPIVGDADLPEPLQPDVAWPEEPVVAEFLSSARPLIDAIGEASNYPTPVWIPIEFAGVGTLLPESQTARSLCRVLRLEFSHAVYHRDKQRAWTALRAMELTADAFNWQAFIITDLVHSALDQVFMEALATSLEADIWEEPELQEWLQRVGKPDNLALRWRNAFAGERYSLLSDSTDWELAMGGSSTIPARVMNLPQARLKLLTAHRRAQELGDGELVDFVDRASRLEAELQADKGLMQLHPGNVAIGLMMPAYSALARTHVRHEDTRRLVSTGLAVKLFEVRMRRWPDSLLELAEIGLTQDDWSSVNRGLFGYSAEGDQAWLWSYPPSNAQSTIPASRPDWSARDKRGIEIIQIR